MREDESNIRDGWADTEQSVIDQLRADLSTAREALRVMGDALAPYALESNWQTSVGSANCDLFDNMTKLLYEDGFEPARKALSHPSVVKAMKEVEK